MSDKEDEDSKPKKIEEELKEEQEKVVKGLLTEMGLTSKEVETILAPGGEVESAIAGEKAVEHPPMPKVEQAPRAPTKPVSREIAQVREEERVGPSGPGVESLLGRLDEMARTVSSLERGIAASLSTKLLEFRQQLIDLRTEIATKLTDRLRMKAFAPLVERAIAEVVIEDVKKLEENLLDSFSKELVAKFKSFKEGLTSSKEGLLAAIKEQAEVYGAHGRSLEDEVTLKEKQIKELREEVAKRDAVMTEQKSTISELDSRVNKLEEELREAAGTAASSLVVKDLKAKIESQQSTIDRLKSQIIETSELKARIKAYEDSIDEKRKKIEEQNARLMEVEGKLAETEVRIRDLVPQNVSLKAEVEKLRNESIETMKDRSKAMELETSLSRAKQEVQDLKGIIEETEDKLGAKKAEVARIVKVMSKEPKYKILTILKDLGTLDFNEIARSIGQPIAIAKRYSQELQQEGYVKIEATAVTGVGDWAKTAKEIKS